VPKEDGSESVLEKVASLTRNPESLSKLGTNEQKNCALVFMLTDLRDELAVEHEHATPEGTGEGK